MTCQCQPSWLPENLCAKHDAEWYGDCHDQHPVYSPDLTMRYANDRDLARLASLADEKEMVMMVERTTVNLSARQIAMLQALIVQGGAQFGDGYDPDIADAADKLNRAANRLYNRGVRFDVRNA